MDVNVIRTHHNGCASTTAGTNENGDGAAVVEVDDEVAARHRAANRRRVGDGVAFYHTASGGCEGNSGAVAIVNHGVVDGASSGYVFVIAATGAANGDCR